MILHNKYIIVVMSLLLYMQTSSHVTALVIGDREFIFHQKSQFGCNLTLFDMDIHTMDSDLIIDIQYQIEYNSSVEGIEISLYLSLDNESYIEGFKHTYDTSLLNESTIDAFFSYSNVIGDPLPFNVQEGQTLYVYVEVETEYGVIQSDVISGVIPMDVTRPWLFNIPSSVFIIAAIVFTVAPCICIGFLVQSYNKRRTPIPR
jgi:hypothetical protein